MFLLYLYPAFEVNPLRPRVSKFLAFQIIFEKKFMGNIIWVVNLVMFNKLLDEHN
jgi:hypothetical protein